MRFFCLPKIDYMNIILFDPKVRTNLLPLTYTRPFADLRFGILTLKEKWEQLSKTATSCLTEEYLTPLFAATKTEENYFINAQFVATKNLLQFIKALTINSCLMHGDTPIAYKLNGNSATSLKNLNNCAIPDITKVNYNDDLVEITELYHLFQKNDWAIKNDIDLLDLTKSSQPKSTAPCKKEL